MLSQQVPWEALAETLNRLLSIESEVGIGGQDVNSFRIETIIEIGNILPEECFMYGQVWAQLEVPLDTPFDTLVGYDQRWSLHPWHATVRRRRVINRGLQLATTPDPTSSDVLPVRHVSSSCGLML